MLLKFCVRQSILGPCFGPTYFVDPTTPTVNVLPRPTLTTSSCESGARVFSEILRQAIDIRPVMGWRAVRAQTSIRSDEIPSKLLYPETSEGQDWKGMKGAQAGWPKVPS